MAVLGVLHHSDMTQSFMTRHRPSEPEEDEVASMDNDDNSMEVDEPEEAKSTAAGTKFETEMMAVWQRMFAEAGAETKMVAWQHTYADA